MRHLPRRFAVTAALAVTGFLVGCDGGNTESTLAGKSATVEYRPVAAEGGKYISKQRAGTIKKVTNEWVSIDEGGNEIWVPRDLVLEIRVDKK